MARKVNASTRQDLLKAIRERYRSGTKDDKLRILDEFVAVTGYHRKHAIRLFKAAPITSDAVRRSRIPLYDEAVREALVVLWEASDRVCGKRLKPLLPLLVSALERHGHLTLASAVRGRVLDASAATLDRLLTSTRVAVSGHRTRRRAHPAVQRNVPVRTCTDWDSPLPGDMEADLVSQRGRVVCRELCPHAHPDRRGLGLDRVRRARRPRRRAGGGGAGADAHPDALPSPRV